MSQKLARDDNVSSNKSSNQNNITTTTNRVYKATKRYSLISLSPNIHWCQERSG